VTPRRTVLAAIAVYAVARAASFLAVLVAARDSALPVLDLLTKADGLRYLAIAADGYPPPPPIGPDGVYVSTTNLAFFPLYRRRSGCSPGRWTRARPPLFAALVAGLVATVLIALWAVRASVRRVRSSSSACGACGRRPWCSGWLLRVAVRRRRRGHPARAPARPLGVGRVRLHPGRSHPPHRRGAPRRAARRARRTPTAAAVVVAAALLAPVGLLVSLGHVAVVTGRLDGWFWLESTVWRSGFDGGRSTVTNAAHAFTGTRTSASRRTSWPLSSVSSRWCCSWRCWRAARRWRRRLRRTRDGDGARRLGYFHCKPRFLGVVLPLFVPPAGGSRGCRAGAAPCSARVRSRCPRGGARVRRDLALLGLTEPPPLDGGATVHDDLEPGVRARRAAASSTTSSCSHTALAPIAIAWSTTAPTREEFTKQSTTSIGPISKTASASVA